MYTRTFGSLPIIFKPQLVHLTRLTDNKHMPKVVVSEWVSLTFQIRNTQRISLALFELKPLWKFVEQQHTGGEQTESIEVTNEHEETSKDDLAECTSINELFMSPGETYRVRLKVRAKRTHGHLHILGIKYKLCVSENPKLVVAMNNGGGSQQQVLDKEVIYGKQLFELKGPRLNNNTQNMRSVVYDVDNRLNLKIINKTPLMQVRVKRYLELQNYRRSSHMTLKSFNLT